jgi:hypothetical protein
LAELRCVGEQLAAAEWTSLLTQAREHGVLALVLTHTASAGLLPLMPPTVAEELLDAYRGAWLTNRRLRGALSSILAALNARGIEVMPVKGVALAARYYGELALRPAGDLDLLVRRSDVREISRTLVEMGYQPVANESDPESFYALIHQALAFRGSAGVIVELHWELANLPAYRSCLPAEALWRRAERIEWQGQSVRYLAPADELRYLCFHYAAQHQSERLIWLVDIAELVRALPAGWDWAAFTQESIANGLATPIFLAFARAHHHLGLVLPTGVLTALREAAHEPSERRRWAAAQAPFHRLESAAQYVLAQRDPRARLRLALALAGRGAARWRRMLAGHWRPRTEDERLVPGALIVAAEASTTFPAREVPAAASTLREVEATSVPHARSG